jgi:Protein of unknown function (DUF4087)
VQRKTRKAGWLIVGLLLFVALIAGAGNPRLDTVAGAANFETRCGWLSNPTPANVWLYDHDGEWTIGVQGGYQVEDDWDWPVFKPHQWVHTNSGSYGYGCACLQLRVNKESHEVLEIKSARARTLANCRQDQSLKRWKSMFK